MGSKYEKFDDKIKELSKEKDTTYQIAKEIYEDNKDEIGKFDRIYGYIKRLCKKINCFEEFEKVEKKKHKIEGGKDTRYEEFVVSKKIKTLDEALKECQADLSIWEVERWVANQWGVTSFKDGEKYATNYQVKLWFKRKDLIKWDSIKKELDKRRSLKVKSNKVRGLKDGVCILSDFHLGAEVYNLIKTPDFNYNVIKEFLSRITDQINNKKYKKVYLFLAGDFIESFTGLNHPNSWKNLSKYGVESIIFAHELLTEYLYKNVNNLNYVGFVSGNHDRVTSSNKEDQFGEAARVLQYLFNKDFKIKSEWSPLLISKTIDNINYIVTHGHLKLASKEVSKIIYDYGKQGIFNVFLKGHKHVREKIDTIKKKKIIYEQIEMIVVDSSDYRAYTTPPLFTGNFFSESLGYTSSAGFLIFENNGFGKPNCFDYTL